MAAGFKGSCMHVGFWGEGGGSWEGEGRKRGGRGIQEEGVMPPFLFCGTENFGLTCCNI